MQKKRKDATRKQEDLLENIAAISAELWSPTTRGMRTTKAGGKSFYDRFGEELSGFPGVWQYSITAARAFTKAEQRFAKDIGTKPDASYEYLDAILPFAEWLAKVEELPTIGELERKAWFAVLGARN